MQFASFTPPPGVRRVGSSETSTFPRFLDLAYPSIERGEGVWLYTTGGEKILDACSGGAMVANLGHGVRTLTDAGAMQAESLADFYMDHFPNEPQERLADRLIEVAAPEMASASRRAAPRPTRQRCDWRAPITSTAANRIDGGLSHPRSRTTARPWPPLRSRDARGRSRSHTAPTSHLTSMCRRPHGASTQAERQPSQSWISASRRPDQAMSQLSSASRSALPPCPRI